MLASLTDGGTCFNLFRYTAGYLGDHVKTAEVFKDGYYLTGDTVYYDDDEYFWFVGNNDDVRKHAG